MTFHASNDLSKTCWEEKIIRMSYTFLITFEKCRSSHQRFSIKKQFLKYLQYSQENACVKSLFWIKFIYKKASNTGVFLWVSQNFQRQLFYRALLVAASIKLNEDSKIIWHKNACSKQQKLGSISSLLQIAVRMSKHKIT